MQLVPMRARAVRWSSGIPTDPDPSHIKLKAQGEHLAQTLGPHHAALMRAHGFVLAGLSASDLVRLAVYIPRNARALMHAMQMGEYKALSRGEIEARLALDIHSPALKRGWEFWAREVGCENLLAD